MKLRAQLTYADRVLKVNHAGEHGAVNIYRGQRLVCFWRDAALRQDLEEFRTHEERHRAIFAAELARRGVRRCRSYALCGFGGFVLGMLTGICGRASIAAVTVAVERVVLRHPGCNKGFTRRRCKFRRSAPSKNKMTARQQCRPNKNMHLRHFHPWHAACSTPGIAASRLSKDFPMECVHPR